MALVQLACGDISMNNTVGLLAAFLITTTDFILINISYVVIFSSVFKSGKAHLKAINTCITHIIIMTFTLISALIAFLSYRIRNNIYSSNRILISILYLHFSKLSTPTNLWMENQRNTAYISEVYKQCNGLSY